MKTDSFEYLEFRRRSGFHNFAGRNDSVRHQMFHLSELRTTDWNLLLHRSRKVFRLAAGNSLTPSTLSLSAIRSALLIPFTTSMTRDFVFFDEPVGERHFSTEASLIRRGLGDSLALDDKRVARHTRPNFYPQIPNEGVFSFTTPRRAMAYDSFVVVAHSPSVPRLARSRKRKPSGVPGSGGSFGVLFRARGLFHFVAVYREVNPIDFA